jgi:RNA polymerase sigma factor (sigma-70 family)
LASILIEPTLTATKPTLNHPTKTSDMPDPDPSKDEPPNQDALSPKERENHELYNIEESISAWIDGAKRGEQEQATTGIYDVYFNRLTRIAQRKLSHIRNTLKDGEDLAIEALASVIRRLDGGLLNETHDRLDLWRILLRIVHCKFVDYIKRETAQKRGGTAINIAQNQEGMIESLVSRDFTHEDEVILNDEIESLVSKLNDQQSEVLFMRMEGQTNQEIAEKLDVSTRSVERKVALIRDKWAVD